MVDKSNVTAPAVNILETEDDFKVEVAAPGMTKEDFKVHINEDNELQISMEKKSENKEEGQEAQKAPTCVASSRTASSSRA